MKTIESPVKGYTGISAGVGFALGKALVKELTPTQEKYFKKRGYIITEDQEVETQDVSKVNTLQTSGNNMLDNSNINPTIPGNLGDID